MKYRSAWTRVLVALLLGFGTLDGVAADTQASAVNPEQELDAARRLLDSWNGQREILRQADEKLTVVLRREPLNYRALKERARYHLMQGYLHERWVDSGRRYYQVGAYVPGATEAAEAAVREAIRINPKFAEGYVLLGHILQEQTRLSEAAKALEHAESLGTNDPWLHLNWASLLSVQGNREAAAERWRRVLNDRTATLKASSVAYGYLIGQHRRAGEHDKAIALWEEQIARDPTDAWLRGGLGKYLLEELGRYDEAIKHLRSALAIMDYGVGRQLLAKAYYRKWAELVAQGKEAEAGPYFEQARSARPNLTEVMVYDASTPNGDKLARALMKKGVSIDAKLEDGSTALLLAVNRNFNDAVRFLLDMKANPNVVDRKGWTPLLSAADEGNLKVAEMLLAHGADIRATRHNLNAPAIAERKGHVELAALLRARAGSQGTGGGAAMTRTSP
jgi:tetratricopeptide (TPR) repeat protein